MKFTQFHFVMILAAALGGLRVAAEPAAPGNLALVARASASLCSPDTSLAALNDGFRPRNSRDRQRGAYGNWPAHGTQWVEYDWSQPISTRRVEVYWWDDHSGVRLPKACRLLYWNGTDFVPVGNPDGLGVAADHYNMTSFDEVTTTKLRLQMDGNGNFSTGLLEWRVLDSGRSPEFPPLVTAGVDRDVMLGGKTWLNGTVNTLKADTAITLAWTKKSLSLIHI